MRVQRESLFGPDNPRGLVAFALFGAVLVTVAGQVAASGLAGIIGFSS